MISKVFPIWLLYVCICQTLATGKSLSPFLYRHSLSAALFQTHPSHPRMDWLKKWTWIVPVLCYVSGLNGGAAHRCCSTVAAGWCCHTSSHTKPPAPTSFLIFSSSSSFQFFPSSPPASPLFLRSSPCRSPLHAVTPSRLPHIHRQTNTPPPAPALLLLSRSCLVTSVKLGATRQIVLPPRAFKIRQVAKDMCQLSLIRDNILDYSRYKMYSYSWMSINLSVHSSSTKTGETNIFYFETKAIRILAVVTFWFPPWQIVLPCRCYYSNRLSSSSC